MPCTAGQNFPVTPGNNDQDLTKKSNSPAEPPSFKTSSRVQLCPYILLLQHGMNFSALPVGLGLHGCAGISLGTARESASYCRPNQWLCEVKWCGPHNDPGFAPVHFISLDTVSVAVTTNTMLSATDSHGNSQ